MATGGGPPGGMRSAYQFPAERATEHVPFDAWETLPGGVADDDPDGVNERLTLAVVTVRLTLLIPTPTVLSWVDPEAHVPCDPHPPSPPRFVHMISWITGDDSVCGWLTARKWNATPPAAAATRSAMVTVAIRWLRKSRGKSHPPAVPYQLRSLTCLETSFGGSTSRDAEHRGQLRAQRALQHLDELEPALLARPVDGQPSLKDPGPGPRASSSGDLPIEQTLANLRFAVVVVPAHARYDEEGEEVATGEPQGPRDPSGIGVPPRLSTRIRGRAQRERANSSERPRVPSRMETGRAPPPGHDSSCTGAGEPAVFSAGTGPSGDEVPPCSGRSFSRSGEERRMRLSASM